MQTDPAPSTAPATAAVADADFMSMLVHQLTTPLGTMRWYAELLQTGKMTNPLDSAQADMVNEILLGATRMSNLLNGIHDISRIEQNKFTDEPASVQLADIITTVQNQQQSEITAKGFSFNVTVDQSVPNVVARPSLITLVVQNLVSNAIKYTPEKGTIQITLRQATNEEAARCKAPGESCVLVSVADTGYGIPKDQQALVFSKFFRGDNVASMGIEGNGLGLAAVAAAVSKLGGALYFDSEEGQGTTMFVVLPTTPLKSST